MRLIRLHLRLGNGAMLALALQAQATAQSPAPAWVPTFGGAPHTGSARALVVADDGSGGTPELFAADTAVEVWDGWSWRTLGSAMNNDILALAVEETEGGPVVYAGGEFTMAGGVAANHVARWSGVQWEPLGAGLNDYVRALAIHDDGTGPALYAAGDFDQSGAAPVAHVAKWDGATWSSVGGGTTSEVDALLVHDDGLGGGPALYAAGFFTTIGGVSAQRIARWDGAAWSPLGAGLLGWAHALAVHDDGSGPALYVAGDIGKAGDVQVETVACWDGVSWSAVGSGLSNIGLALTSCDLGDGPALYVGGDLALNHELEHVARLDGSTWVSLAGGTGGSGYVYALAGHDDGGTTGPALVAGGIFSEAGGVIAKGVARWNGEGWSCLGAGPSSHVSALEPFDDGGGQALYVGGWYFSLDGAPSTILARWDGSDFTAVDGLNNDLLCLATFDDGGGLDLYAGGEFTQADGLAVNSIARWDGAAWSALGAGLNDDVEVLGVFDDGTGDALYAGGKFTSAGGAPVSRIAKWDGAGWSPLGGGLDGTVLALATFDDGGGPALFAGGSFATAGGVPASRIARWDGAGWSALGSGVADVGGSNVDALTVYDDGTGAALYVGGDFTLAGGTPANRIARWDGSAWSALGSGLNGNVNDLLVHDDGGGPQLCACGTFTQAGTKSVKRVARWNGTAWSALGGGMDGDVHVLESCELADGAGPALFAGGDFLLAESGDGRLARWGLPVPTPPWTDLGFGLAGQHGVPDLSGDGPLTVGSAGSLLLADAASSAPTLLFVSVSSMPAAFKGGLLVPLPALLVLPASTDVSGALALAWTSWPAGLPSGSQIYFQCAILDALAPFGASLSQALLATTP